MTAAPVVVVLAAGAGRRLGGVAKALLCDAGGPTYLEQLWQRARDGGAGAAVVVAGPPHLEATSAEAARLGLLVAVNPDPERGMASSVSIGFAAALEASDADRALLWPVNHPRVEAETVRRLLASAGDAGVVVPVYAGKGGHPTLFARALWPELVACAGAADGARAVVRSVPERVVRIDVEDRGVIADVDTRADLR